MKDEYFDDIIGLLYEAALQPEYWQPALQTLCQAMHCDAGQMAYWDRPNQRPIFSAVSRDDLRQLDEQYVHHFAAIDPHTAKIREHPSGIWLNYARVFDASYVQRNEVYQEYLIPNGLRWSLAARFDTSRDSEAIFALLRSPHKSPFGSDDERFLQRLSPHLQRAAKIHENLLRTEAQATLGASALHRLAYPLLISDRNGKMVFHNSAADASLQRGAPLYLKEGFIALSSANEQARFMALLDDAVMRRHGGGMTVSDDSSHLTVVPLAPDMAIANPWERPLALVMFSAKRAAPMPSSELLGSLFGLTGAESRAATALLTGLTPEEFANTAGLSIATVRSQLREVYAKTGTRRQAELVQLLAMLAALNENSEFGETPTLPGNPS